MEHRHRSNHREHLDSANDASDRRKREAAIPSRAHNEHQTYKEDRLIPKHHGIRGNHSQAALANQLSGDDDYVRTWLAQTDEEANQKKSGYHEARQKMPSQSPPFPAPQIGTAAADAAFSFVLQPKACRRHRSRSGFVTPRSRKSLELCHLGRKEGTILLPTAPCWKLPLDRNRNRSRSEYQIPKQEIQHR
jgi:hypothetical protein